jgi:hypothetical protein
MDAEVLYHSLKVIEEIYNESMYGVNDIYRIKDIVHSLDKNHWESKQWVVDELHKVYTTLWPDNNEYRQIFIAGGWYGLLANLLRDKYPSNEIHIVSSDMDPMTEYYGYKLFPNKDIQFRTENSLQAPEISTARVIINTSCEHMTRNELCEWIGKKEPDSLIVLQSNNFFDHPTHINCSKYLDDFAWYVKEALPKKWVAYRGEVDLGTFKRFMVIGQ